MVNWLGIEDASPSPHRVWLSREVKKDESSTSTSSSLAAAPWKPLRKCDCQALNASPDKPVLIECGRATADPTLGVIYYNFYRQRKDVATTTKLELTSATWFAKTSDSNASSSESEGSSNNTKPKPLLPLTLAEAVAVEDLYQQAVHATSSIGSGIDNLLKERIPLEGEFHAAIQKDNGRFVVRKCPNGWFGKSIDLQRGYGCYVVEGEEEEMLLASVNHLVFFVHGIGEAMWSRDDVNTNSLAEELEILRKKMQKRQVEEWKQACEACLKSNQEQPDPPHRVELIPIFWYDQVHSSSSALGKTLKATTLTTIPALREIANDVILDVLMYMTPGFCHDVLECVTDQICDLYSVFLQTHPDFQSQGGVCSLVGHSLGSVIVWDMLSILQEDNRSNKQKNTGETGDGHYLHGVHIVNDTSGSSTGYQQYASGEGANQAKYGNWGPSLPKPMDRCLPFAPDFTLFLGSPVGLFLTLRGAHPVFEELRKSPSNSSTGNFRISPFFLPTGSMHNIFHPSDPVAYRIEPLLLSPDTTEFPPPLYVTREGHGVRLHVKAMQVGGEIRRSLMETQHSLSSFVSVLTDQAMKTTKLLENSSSTSSIKEGEKGTVATIKSGKEGEKESSLEFPLAGKAKRLDYQLQPRVIDNEYISAVLAHGSYFSNTDVIDYIIDLTKTQKVKEQD